MISFRMMAVMATLNGFALVINFSCLAFSSWLNRMATMAGMYRAWRRSALPQRMNLLPFHVPDLRVIGASPAVYPWCPVPAFQRV